LSPITETLDKFMRFFTAVKITCLFLLCKCSNLQKCAKATNHAVFTNVSISINIPRYIFSENCDDTDTHIPKHVWMLICCPRKCRYPHRNRATNDTACTLYRTQQSGGFFCPRCM